MIDIRDNSHLYRRMKRHDLEELKSRKLMQKRRLERQHASYLVMQEIKRINYHVKQIEAEIASRDDQLDLF